MAFDINEARAIIEDAKKRGMIRTGNEASSGTSAEPPKTVKEGTSGAVIPDWLQEGIRQGPLSRSDDTSGLR